MSQEEIDVMPDTDDVVPTDESAPPVDEAILRLKEQKEIEYAEMCKRWGPVVFVAPFAPLCLAVINLFICTLVVNIASSDCVQPINIYLVGQIVMSYILLIAYAFAVIGPVRLTRFEPAKWFAVIFSLFAIVWNLVGTAFMAGSGPCAETAPSMLKTTQFQVIQFWLVLIVVLIYYLRYRYQKYQKAHAREADLQAKLDAELMDGPRTADGSLAGSDDEGSQGGSANDNDEEEEEDAAGGSGADRLENVQSDDDRPNSERQ